MGLRADLRAHLIQKTAPPRSPGAARGQVSNQPYSRKRLRDDLVTALPALGMIVGAVAGAVLGLVNPDASPVSFAGIGIAAGLVLGAFLRVVFRRE